MPRMILLGVGTAVPDIDRDHTHMVWDTPGGALLIDAGGSTYQRLLRAGIEPPTLRGLLVTHTHPDHINGIPALLFSMFLAGRRHPFAIYGLPETLEMLERILAACAMAEYTTPIRWEPLSLREGETRVVIDEPEWSLSVVLNQHSRPCFAMRFVVQPSGRALVYSGDTAPCDAVAALAQGASLLIHEATVSEPMDSHTTPRQAGEIAAHAGVERLILVHYSPRWTMPPDQALADVHAGGFTGHAEIGQEYQSLDVSEQIDHQ